MCSNTLIDLNVILVMTSITIVVDYHRNYLLCFEQQQRSSAHYHALSLINHGDANDSEDIDEWDWRSMSGDDNQDNALPHMMMSC